jgi:hypothetical protein
MVARGATAPMQNVRTVDIRLSLPDPMGVPIRAAVFRRMSCRVAPAKQSAPSAGGFGLAARAGLCSKGRARASAPAGALRLAHVPTPL